MTSFLSFIIVAQNSIDPLLQQKKEEYFNDISSVILVIKKKENICSV